MTHRKQMGQMAQHRLQHDERRWAVRLRLLGEQRGDHLVADRRVNFRMPLSPEKR
jgi:hypothetical protein